MDFLRNISNENRYMSIATRVDPNQSAHVHSLILNNTGQGTVTEAFNKLVISWRHGCTGTHLFTCTHMTNT